jgi:CDP-diacylglycerol--serine O-phosphatidyltransferase
MRHLPNILTSINLLCGCLAIVALQDGTPYLAYGFFFIALIMDFLDGMVARALNAYSELGKQLDSLADLLSFGVFPGFLWLKLFYSSQWNIGASAIIGNLLLPVLAFLFTLAVALRLAKFNIDERQSTDFLGLPSPAAALFTVGFFYWVTNSPETLYELGPSILGEGFSSHFNPIINQPWFILTILIAISAMMLVEIPMFSLKIKRWQWAGNEIKIIFVALSIVLLLIWQLMALPLIIILFILISIVRPFLKSKNG